MRILTYSLDSCGMGHLRGTFATARKLAREVPGAHVLSVIGSPMAKLYFSPEGGSRDYIKLPCVEKIGVGEYRPRYLDLEADELMKLRHGLIESAFEAFDPDVAIIDKTPRGLNNELGEALMGLIRSRNIFVIRLRPLTEHRTDEGSGTLVILVEL